MGILTTQNAAAPALIGPDAIELAGPLAPFEPRRDGRAYLEIGRLARRLDSFALASGARLAFEPFADNRTTLIHAGRRIAEGRLVDASGGLALAIDRLEIA